MKPLPFAQLIAFTTAVVLLTCGLGFIIDLKTNNLATMLIAMLLSLTIGITLIQRWWVPKVRASGVPATKPTRERVLIGLATLVSIAASVAAEHYVFELTRNRFAEAAVAICAMLPVGFILLPEAFLRLRPVTASEAQIGRFNYYAQFFLYIPMALNLIVQLTDRHRDGSLTGLAEWNIAGNFAVLMLSPFMIRVGRRRYLEAKALKDAEPPDRWQAYNNKLAQNE
jgi:hypothetical protein